jgi:hypothetical protein
LKYIEVFGPEIKIHFGALTLDLGIWNLVIGIYEEDKSQVDFIRI